MRRSLAHRSAGASRAGLSLLEVLLALSLLVIVLAKGFAVLDDTAEATAEGNASTLLEERAQLALERIARAIMGSSREALAPSAESPLSSDEIRFQIHLGIEDGEVVWSDPEEIRLEDFENQVVWSRIPEAGEEQRVVWTRFVSPFLEGELPNGMDDNGNGLIDEKGLSFVVDRNAVHIRLTLERVAADGSVVNHSVETTVTCRNPLQEVDS